MRRLVFASAIVLAVASPVGSAAAASVAPIPVPPGPQNAATVAARFGIEPGTWSEIRFTDPTNQSLATGTHTKSVAGNTVTITVTPSGTVDFTSLKPIEAVYVNKGNGPTSANAIYRYVPPVERDTDLGLLPVTLSGVDHLVLWWARNSTTTTAPTTTTAVPSTTVSTSAVLAASSSAPPVAVAPTATTAVPILPATGSPGPSTVIVGSVLVFAGMLVLLAHRTARPQ